MENTISGKVYLAHGGSILLDSTDKQLDAVLLNMYPAGSVLQVTIQVKPVGEYKFCTAPSKYYGTCDHALKTHLGDCPNEANHATEEEIAEREAERASRK